MEDKLSTMDSHPRPKWQRVSELIKSLFCKQKKRSVFDSNATDNLETQRPRGTEPSQKPKEESPLKDFPKCPYCESRFRPEKLEEHKAKCECIPGWTAPEVVVQPSVPITEPSNPLHFAPFHDMLCDAWAVVAYGSGYGMEVVGVFESENDALNALPRLWNEYLNEIEHRLATNVRNRAKELNQHAFRLRFLKFIFEMHAVPLEFAYGVDLDPEGVLLGTNADWEDDIKKGSSEP